MFCIVSKLFNTHKKIFFCTWLQYFLLSVLSMITFQHCNHNEPLNSAKLVLRHCSQYQPLNSAKLVLEWCEREVFSPVWESVNFIVIRCNISHISMTFRSREWNCLRLKVHALIFVKVFDMCSVILVSVLSKNCAISGVKWWIKRTGKFCICVINIWSIFATVCVVCFC